MCCCHPIVILGLMTTMHSFTVVAPSTTPGQGSRSPNRIANATVFLQLTTPTITSPYSSVALHPDGQILGTGTEDGVVHVWETRSQNVSQIKAQFAVWQLLEAHCITDCALLLCNSPHQQTALAMCGAPLQLLLSGRHAFRVHVRCHHRHAMICAITKA